MKNRKPNAMKTTAISCLLFALTACEESNPLGNSVITAHGNTDWHIDTAEEFLYGTEMDGTASAANHVPDTWIKRHMHVVQTNAAKFYHDADIVASGEDADATNGIDRSMLFFYAGHGAPTFWNALGTNASQANMLLSNYSEANPGLLRYYWQCSCDVFAHGPSTCDPGTGTDFTYGCPEQFDSSADSSSMRNVFERWGPALGTSLRMACGASTAAYCHESETNRIWDNYNNKSYDVADSFIYGLHTNSGSRANVIPLCIARGNASAGSTPLYDQTFSALPNPVGNGSYLHIQFLSNFRSNVPWFTFDIPKLLPIYRLIPLPIPEQFMDIKFENLEELLVSPEQIDERGAKVRIATASGAISVLGEQIKEASFDALDEKVYISMATEFLRENGLYESDTLPAFGTAMKFQTQGEDGQTVERQKNVKVMFKRTVPIEGIADPIPVLGEGGLIEVQMNNDGSVFASTKVWRPLGEVVDELPVKTYEEALGEAQAQIEKLDNYRVNDWRFGYQETSGIVEQKTLGVVYEFSFYPVSDDLLVEYPPQTVVIDGFIR